MPTPALIDIDALLTPIAGANPAGEALGFMDREALNELRRESNPDDYPPNDPRRPPEKKADWAKIIDKAKQLLTEKSKDLHLAARLTEALTKRHGFGGLRDGLKLMRRLVEDCADRLHPEIEVPDDLERRAAAFNWLDDPDHAAKFPTSLRQLALISSSVKGDPPYAAVSGYCYNDWKITEKGVAPVPPAEFERVLKATPAMFLRTLQEDLAECETEIETTVKSLAARLESFAPALTEIRSALTQCKGVVQGVIQKRPDVGATAGNSASGEAAGADGQQGAGMSQQTLGIPESQVANREGVYRQIAHLAGLLRQLEPHSPIPYLLDRAVELGRLPFPQLLKELVRDGNQLGEVNREFGIKDAETPAS